MDIKRIIMWVVFLGSLVFLWDNWMVSNGKPSMFAAPPAKSTKLVANPADTANPHTGVSHTPAGLAATALPSNVVGGPVQGELIAITTDLVKVEVDTLGGDVKRLELLHHKDGVDPTKNVVLFDKTEKRVYLAQTGLIGDANGVALPSHKSLFVAKPGARSLGGADQVELVLETEQSGVKLIKTYIFKRGDYLIDVKHQVRNESSAAVSPTLYMQLIHDGTKPENGSIFTGTGDFYAPAVYTNEEHFQKLDFEKIEKNKAEHAKKADNGWVAVIQHFFVSGFIPATNVQREIFTDKVSTNLYSVGMKLPLGTIAPGAGASMDASLYSGPQQSAVLEKVAPGFELVKDYGWLTILCKPMFWVMDQIHKVLGNWGWTIVAFTVLIKLMFFHLSAAGYRSMAKMKVLTPKMQAIRDRHKSDPQKMNQAMMELYKTEKANPLGGCLPILIQMPIFIALYWVLQASVEMRGAPWIGWIHDLASPDPWYILPVLYAISMYVQTKLNPTPPTADPMQAKMMQFMPLAFSVIFFFFPAGLVLYWVVNNVLSIAQQWVITKNMEKAQKA